MNSRFDLLSGAQRLSPFSMNQSIMNSRFDLLSGAQRLSPFSMNQRTRERSRNNGTGFSLNAGGEGKEGSGTKFHGGKQCLPRPSRRPKAVLNNAPVQIRLWNLFAGVVTKSRPTAR